MISVVCSYTGYNPNKVYLGTAEDDFKKRFYNHRNSFNNEASANDNTLSKYIWELKEISNLSPTLVWSIAKCMYIHHWLVIRSSCRKLGWVEFEPSTTGFRTNSMTYQSMISTKSQCQLCTTTPLSDLFSVKNWFCSLSLSVARFNTIIVSHE